MTSETHVLSLFSQHSYFQSIETSIVQQIIPHARQHVFQPEEMIFVEGEPASGLWMIEFGSVKISRIGMDGAEHIMHLLGPGDAFNDIAAVDGGPNPATAAALSLAVCWMLPREVLREALANHPEIAENVIGLLASRVRMLANQLEELALYSVLVRLSRFLLNEADNPALEEPGVTRAAIAAHLATTPETISRTLFKLQEMSCIRFDRHRIMITDREALRSIALL
jgi:CRP-like cAMP-binding protein